VNRVGFAELPANNHRLVIDVRGESEWNAGHMPSAKHLFLGDLAELARDIPRDTPIALHCQGGTRASIAASVLQAEGFTNVAASPAGFANGKQRDFPSSRRPLRQRSDHHLTHTSSRHAY
jgi:Rhodanese-related sulfurtransferase